VADLPFKFLPIGELRGDDEAAESIALPTLLSSDGSRNVTIDKLARARSIGGYLRQNAVAITTNTGAVATLLRSITHYTRQIAGETLRQELGIFDDGVNHWELRRSIDLGQTWAFIKDYGVGSPGRIPSWASLGNIQVLVNGSIPVQSWDGNAISDASSVQLGAPIIADVGTGQLTGSFRWKIVVRKPDGTRKTASAWSARTALTGRKTTVTWAADVDAASYEVYRTTGTGEIAFFEGSVAAGTLTFSDNIADLDLINGRMLQEYGDAPLPGIYHVFIHKSRVWYLRTNDAPRTVYYSDPGLPFSVHTAASFIDCTDAESFSDVAAGGIGNFENMAVIFLERSVWVISGTGNPAGVIIDFQRRRSSARTGACHVNTVARVTKGAQYLDSKLQIQTIDQNALVYLTPYGDLRVFDGQYDTIIGFAKQAAFKRLNYAQRHKAYVVTDTPRNECTWVFPADDSIEPNVAVTWNTLYGTMTERLWPFACIEEVESESSSSILLAGEAQTGIGGFCYRLWTGDIQADGSGTGMQVMTKTLYGGGGTTQYGAAISDKALLQFDKRWRWADLLLQADGDITALVEWWAGEADPRDIPYGYLLLPQPTTALYTADRSLLKDADGNTLYAANLKSLPRARLKNLAGKYLHSRGLRLRISQALYSSLVQLLRPVGYWRLGELEGTTAYDTSGGLSHGVYVGGATLGQAGLVGDGNMAASFDGANDAVTIVNSGRLNAASLGTGLTLSAIVTPASIALPNGQRMCVSLGTDGKNYLSIKTNAAPTFFASMQIGGVQQTTDSLVAPVVGTTTRLVAAYDGAALKIYVNGVLRATTACTGVVDTANGGNAIGDYVTALAANWGWSGVIDEVAVWDRGLTAGEVALLDAARLYVPRGWSLSGMLIAFQMLAGLRRNFRQ
jgi:hypothetical protein